MEELSVWYGFHKYVEEVDNISWLSSLSSLVLAWNHKNGFYNTSHNICNMFLKWCFSFCMIISLIWGIWLKENQSCRHNCIKHWMIINYDKYLKCSDLKNWKISLQDSTDHHRLSHLLILINQQLSAESEQMSQILRYNNSVRHSTQQGYSAESQTWFIERLKPKKSHQK